MLKPLTTLPGLYKAASITGKMRQHFKTITTIKIKDLLNKGEESEIIFAVDHRPAALTVGRRELLCRGTPSLARILFTKCRVKDTRQGSGNVKSDFVIERLKKLVSFNILLIELSELN